MSNRLAVLGYAILAWSAIATLALLAVVNAPPEGARDVAEFAVWIVAIAGLGVVVVALGVFGSFAQSGWRMLRKSDA